MTRLLVVALLGLAAVSQAEPVVLETHLDSFAVVSLGGTELRLDWTQVEDSRCPDGVTCVWEGEVGGQFSLQAADVAPSLFALTRHHAGDPRATQIVNGYQVRLLQVTPYPRGTAGTARQDYRALLALAPVGEELPDVVTAIGGSTWGQLKLREARP